MIQTPPDVKSRDWQQSSHWSQTGFPHQFRRCDCTLLPQRGLYWWKKVTSQALITCTTSLLLQRPDLIRTLFEPWTFDKQV